VFLRSVFQLLVNSNVAPSFLRLFTLMIEAMFSSETSAIKRATRRHITEDIILYSNRHEYFQTALHLLRVEETYGAIETEFVRSSDFMKRGYSLNN
jgi:hypothetical protein